MKELIITAEFVQRIAGGIPVSFICIQDPDTEFLNSFSDITWYQSYPEGYTDYYDMHGELMYTGYEDD